MFLTPWLWAWASKTSSLNENEDEGGLLEVSSRFFMEHRVHGFCFLFIESCTQVWATQVSGANEIKCVMETENILL